MRNHLIRRGEKGQIAILLAFAMVGLLGIVGLALDGGMLYWNQRRAQNGADAAAISGVGALSAIVTQKSYDCSTSDETNIQKAVHKYAASNEVPDENGADNVRAYYLRQDASGDWVEITNPETNQPWKVGESPNHIPCGVKVRGLRVETNFPQPTFIAGIIGIAETNVEVDASAIFNYNTWCTDFAVIALSQECKSNILGLTGSDITLEGGAHSNGGMGIEGGGQGIYLEPDMPVEYGEACEGTSGVHIAQDSKITGGPLPDEPGKGITSADYFTLSEDDIGYRFEDFMPGHWIWNEAIGNRFYNADPYKNIITNDVKNPDGTLKDGLYVSEGGIKLNRIFNVGQNPWNVTLVSKKPIVIDGGFKQTPNVRGIFIFTLSNDLTSGAVNLSGDGNEWVGLILAPNGKVSMSGAKNSDLGGMIVGYEVDMSGSNLSIRRRDGYCPYNPPAVLLTE